MTTRKSISKHTLKNLKNYHKHASQFFGSQLTLLKAAIPKVSDDRQAKAAMLLMSGGQTGAALLQLAKQTDTFTGESVMLARAFMEKMINFCYVCICDDKEYRAFILHPIYKHYHNLGSIRLEDNLDLSNVEQIPKNYEEKQRIFKEKAIVQEALALFSETKPNMSWTSRTLNERIEVIENWGKLLDVFFRFSKMQYYADASEALHGSLYGCTYGIGAFDPEFDREKKGELSKKLYKENACVLLHLGMLIHETFTMISYKNNIQEIWGYSYQNRGNALNLLFHVLEREIPSRGYSKRILTNEHHHGENQTN